VSGGEGQKNISPTPRFRGVTNRGGRLTSYHEGPLDIFSVSRGGGAFYWTGGGGGWVLGGGKGGGGGFYAVIGRGFDRKFLSKKLG